MMKTAEIAEVPSTATRTALTKHAVDACYSPLRCIVPSLEDAMHSSLLKASHFSDKSAGRQNSGLDTGIAQDFMRGRGFSSTTIFLLLVR